MKAFDVGEVVECCLQYLMKIGKARSINKKNKETGKYDTKIKHNFITNE